VHFSKSLQHRAA